MWLVSFMFFFFNDTATTEIYTYLHTLSLHDALPIWIGPRFWRLVSGVVSSHRSEAPASHSPKPTSAPIIAASCFRVPQFHPVTGGKGRGPTLCRYNSDPSTNMAAPLSAQFNAQRLQGWNEKIGRAHV